MENIHGKEISLQYVTVKVPGQKPRGSKSIITTLPGGQQAHNGSNIHDSIGGLSLSGNFYIFYYFSISICKLAIFIYFYVSFYSDLNVVFYGFIFGRKGLCNFTGYQSKDGKTQRFTDKVLLTAFEVLKEPGRTALGTTSNQAQDDLSSSSSIIASTNGEASSLGSAASKLETPHVKKRHRRMKSSGLKKDGDGDGTFILISKF